MEAVEDLEDEESSNGEEKNEGSNYYGTEYMDWEAKEVIDLISNSDESG